MSCKKSSNKTECKYHKITIPVKPYIKKFCKFLYGETALADKNSTLGLICQTSLTKQLYDNRHQLKSFESKGYSSVYTIQINRWQFDRIGFGLTDQAINNINHFLENYFQESLYIWCANRVDEFNRYAGYRTHIEDFAEHYELDLFEDISMDALQKMEYRFRTRKQKEEQKRYKIFCANLSAPENKPIKVKVNNLRPVFSRVENQHHL